MTAIDQRPRRFRERGRSSGLVVGLVVLAAVAAGWSEGLRAWRSGEVEALGIGFRYPTGWSVQRVENDLKLATHTGVVLTNVEHRFGYPAPPSYTVDACIEGRPQFYVHVYFFPRSSPVDRLRAWRMVGSIAPELRPS